MLNKSSTLDVIIPRYTHRVDCWVTTPRETSESCADKKKKKKQETFDSLGKKRKIIFYTHLHKRKLARVPLTYSVFHSDLSMLNVSVNINLFSIQ